MILSKLKYICFFFMIFLFACSNNEEVVYVLGGDTTDPNPDTDQDSDTNTDPNNGACDDEKTAVFVEKNGLLAIELENGNFKSTSWNLSKNLSDFSGDGYLVWNGSDYFNQPGNGKLSFSIRIATTGTYRFIWRSYITIGNENTEHNDSWLRIPDAKHFYGKKNNGHIVYPNETLLDPIPDSIDQQNTTPNGTSKEGWFKIYMNTADNWHWQSSTSDNDGHNIFVVFDTPGDYTIEISGRSKGHGIDKLVLFTDDVSQTEATKDDVVKSEIKCE